MSNFCKSNHSLAGSSRWCVDLHADRVQIEVDDHKNIELKVC